MKLFLLDHHTIEKFVDMTDRICNPPSTLMVCPRWMLEAAVNRFANVAVLLSFDVAIEYLKWPK